VLGGRRRRLVVAAAVPGSTGHAKRESDQAKSSSVSRLGMV
jgi:hypothetical protein